MKTRVKDVLRIKGDQVWSVTPDATVFDALKLMADQNIGSVLVMDGDRLVGILSERDYARKVVLYGKSSRQTPVREIMTSAVETISPEESIERCMALMTEKRIRHLPVVVDERVAGLISIGDVVKAIIEEQAFLLDQMEAYIAGQPT
jgi:CBS domain-containing protein